MTNGEKFKSAKERATEFRKFCKPKRCEDCVFKNSSNSNECHFLWLELEHNVKLKPCPFCGGEVVVFEAGEEYHVSCTNDDCIATVAMKSFPSEEEAVTAWNKRTK